jgi:small subunit ribosomal protein S6
MRHYELTFIVDPVLSGDEVKATAQKYADMITNEGATITATDEMGLRQLAYEINKRTSGVYYCIEFAGEEVLFIPKLELAMVRDENVLRFLTITLDKFGVKYNDDKRKGLIGKKKKEVAPTVKEVTVPAEVLPIPEIDEILED